MPSRYFLGQCLLYSAACLIALYFPAPLVIPPHYASGWSYLFFPAFALIDLVWWGYWLGLIFGIALGVVAIASFIWFVKPVIWPANQSQKTRIIRLSVACAICLYFSASTLLIPLNNYDQSETRGWSYLLYPGLALIDLMRGRWLIGQTEFFVVLGIVLSVVALASFGWFRKSAKQSPKARILRLVALPIVLVAVSWGQGKYYYSGFPPRDTEPGISAIYEAVFRYQLNGLENYPGMEPHQIYLEIGGTNPSPEFMNRFQDYHPAIRPRSEFKLDFKASTGTILRIETLKWLDKNTVEIEGGYYSGPLSAEGLAYRVIFKDGKWIVEKAVHKWIS